MQAVLLENISFKDTFTYFTRCAEALLNIYIEHNEESLGGTEQQSDLLMTSGYQEMYSASQQRNTERINIQGFDNNGNNTSSAYTL